MGVGGGERNEASPFSQTPTPPTPFPPPSAITPNLYSWLFTGFQIHTQIDKEADRGKWRRGGRVRVRGGGGGGQ